MGFASSRPAPLILCICLFLAACGDARKVTLNGQVRDAYTKEPIEGAQVIIAKQAGVPTNQDGRYTTQAWQPNDTAVIKATGYETATIDLAQRPELKKSQVLTHTLHAELRPNTLSGVIKDAFSDQPIAGAVVKVSGRVTTTTDASGRYELSGVPEAFQITVTAPEHEQQRTEVQRETAKDVALRPTTLTGEVTDKDSNKPIEGVKVVIGEVNATTGADGRFTLKNVPPDGDLVFTREGYAEIRMPLSRATTLDVVMDRNVVEGVVRDATSSAVLSGTVVIATDNASGTVVASVRTDNDGRFRLQNVPEGATIKALRPGYRRGETRVADGALKDELKLQPFDAKAIYVKANVAAARDNTAPYFEIIDKTEVNSLVLDVKSDNLEDVGLIYYQSKVPQVQELGTSADKMDVQWILAEAKKRNVYTIARIHIFAHDNALLKVKPEWYVQDTTTGKPWFADFGIAWLDTYDERVWDYNIQLAVEAAKMGFDEIQFDYIRFPSDGDLSNAKLKGPRDWKNNPDEMYNTIGRFMERAHKAINEAGAFFSVDVFGYVSWEPQPNVGQSLKVMGKYADYVCPMVYPSHFLPNELNLGNPAAHPFELVDHSMQKVKSQLEGEASRARVRPWLQDFTLIWVPKSQIVRYGVAEVRAQIDAAEKNGTSGWSLWDSDNDYTVEALKPE